MATGQRKTQNEGQKTMTTNDMTAEEAAELERLEKKLAKDIAEKLSIVTGKQIGRAHV